MDIAEYESLTGLIVSTNDTDRVTAIITRTQKILEDMLGFSLEDYDTNEYDELGKTKSECICASEINIDDLDPADSVICAYRIFDYNDKDNFLPIDPCTEINAVKLVVGDVTIRTLVEFEDYRIDVKNGLIRYLEKLDCCWYKNLSCYDHVQLAVDANWVWDDEDDIPIDLQYVWADLITYYSDCSKDIKSESLGPHSYTKFDNISPENQSQNIKIIKKYSGPNGSLNRVITQ